MAAKPANPVLFQNNEERSREMDEKYIKLEMGRIWGEENKYQIWLKVEIAVLEAKAVLGLIPREIASEARANARFQIAEIETIDLAIDQEMVAFLRVVTSSLPP